MLKFVKKSLVVSFFMYLTTAIPISFVFAEDFETFSEGLDAGKYGAVSSPTAMDIVLKFTEFFLGIAGALAVLLIMYSGILYITSTGDNNRIDSAKNTFRYSVIGLLVVLTAYIIVYTISKVFMP